MAVYTKTGDKGETGSFDGRRISKSSDLINTIGAIDELNSFLGITLATARGDTKILRYKDIQKKILSIQEDLFVINSILAGSKLKFSSSKTKKLEKQIDIWEGKLPVQKNFFFYGGHPQAAMVFYARALCRRAERSLVKLEIGDWRLEILAYINRLSDYLFTMARSINFEEKVEEKFWKT